MVPLEWIENGSARKPSNFCTVAFRSNYSILLIGVFLLAVTSSALAAPYEGMASYAAMNPRFPCDQWLQMEDLAAKPAMVVLWHVFGDDQSCIVKFLNRYQAKPHLLEVYLSGKNCHFEDVPCAYSDASLLAMTPATEEAITKRALGIDAMIVQNANTNTRIVIAPLLEDGVSDDAFRNLTAVVRSSLPYDIVRARATAGVTNLVELHQNSAKVTQSCIANEDGLKQSYKKSARFLQHYSQCDAVFLWRCDMQGDCPRKKPLPSLRNYIISLADQQAATLLK